LRAKAFDKIKLGGGSTSQDRNASNPLYATEEEAKVDYGAFGVSCSIYYAKSLEIRLITLGPKHPDTSSSYVSIGKVYSEKKGEHNKALECYLKSA
jgi:hypothetical protein